MMRGADGLAAAMPTSGTITVTLAAIVTFKNITVRHRTSTDMLPAAMRVFRNVQVNDGRMTEGKHSPPPPPARQAHDDPVAITPLTTKDALQVELGMVSGAKHSADELHSPQDPAEIAAAGNPFSPPAEMEPFNMLHR